MRFLAPILANLLVVTAAVGFGSLLKCFLPRNFLGIDRLAFTVVGGLGLLGVVLFCVGQVWFSRPAILLIVILGCLLGIKTLAGAVRNRSAILQKVIPPVIPAMVVAAVLLVAAIGGLAAVTGDMNWDPVAYHYLGPKVWLREGVIRPVPDESLTAFPVTVESLYAALISIGGERAPQFFAFVGIGSTLLMAAGLAMRLGLSSSGAWWAAALIVTMPIFFRSGCDGYIDVLLAGFILGAARLGFDAVNRSDYVLFGTFCGLAMSTKYTALISWVLLSFCAVLVAIRYNQRDSRVVLKDLAIASVAAIVIACPVYLRNWILLGCPIYPPPPALLRFFHVKYMSPQAVQNIYENVVLYGRGMGHGFWSYLKLPFNLTYHTANFRGAGGIGLVPLALAPLGILASHRDGFAKGLALFAALQVTAWFLTSQDARYVDHCFAIAVIFGVAGWEYVVKLGSRFGRLLSGVVVACSILYGLVMIVEGSAVDMHAAISESFEAKRKKAEIPFLESFEYINREPSVTKVLILHRGLPGYYCDKPYVKPIGRYGEEAIPGGTDLQSVLLQLSTLHVSHILDVRWDDWNFLIPENQPGLRLVFQRPDQRIYAVIPAP